jgi:hypothetical protein
MNMLRISILLTLLTPTVASAALCLNDKVPLGGCRDKAWITANLATSQLLAFGSCNSGVEVLVTNHCTMWFSELNSEVPHLSFEATIHFMNDTLCTGTDTNCLGGYARVGRVKLSVAGTPERVVSGTAKIAAAVPHSMSATIGSIGWTERSGGYEYSAYSGGGAKIGGLLISDSLFSFSVERCDATVGELIDNGGAGDGGGYSYESMASGADVIKARTARLPIIGNPGEAFANISKALPGSVGHTLGEWARLRGLCSF